MERPNSCKVINWKEMRRFYNENEEEERKRKRRRRSPLIGLALCSCLLFLFLVLASAGLMVGIIVPNLNRNAEVATTSMSTTQMAPITTTSMSTTEMTTTAAPVAEEFIFSCPSLEMTSFRSEFSQPRLTICSDNVGDIYVFDGRNSGQHRMYTLNIDNPLNPTPDITLVNGTYPGELGSYGPVVACTWVPDRGEFVVSTQSRRMYWLDKNGTMSTRITTAFSGGVTSMTYYPPTNEIMATPNYDIDILNLSATDLSLTAPSGYVRPEFNPGSGSFGFSESFAVAVEYDPDSQRLLLISRFIDEEFQGPRPVQFDILKLQPSGVHIAQRSCVPDSFAFVNGFARHRSGRWYMTTGRFGYHRLFTFAHSYAATNETESESYELICDADITQLITDEYLANFTTLNGTVCNDAEVFDVTAFPGATYAESRLRQSLSSSYAMPAQETNCSGGIALSQMLNVVVEPVIEDMNATSQERLRNVSPQFYDSVTFGIAGILTNTDTFPSYVSAFSTPTRIMQAGPRLVSGTRYASVSFMGTFLIVGQSGPVACRSHSSEQVAHYDHETDVIITVWTPVSRDRLCFATLPGSLSGTVNYFEFDFSGQLLHRLQFSVWGDYYTATWNDQALGAGAGDSQLYVFERDAFLNATMPRFVQLTAPSIVAVDGERATSVPHNQPKHNGPRGPMNTAFPCGIFSAITSASGGMLNMKLCQSVDFDTMMATTIESMTTVGSFDNGASGSCTSETACIPGNGIEYDPLRYELAAAYRHFPNDMGKERVVYAITANANGVDVAQPLVGSFYHVTDGTLTTDVPMKLIDLRDDSFMAPAHCWSPSLLITPHNFVVLNAYSTFANADDSYSHLFYTTFKFAAKKLDFVSMTDFGIDPSGQSGPTTQPVMGKQMHSWIINSNREFALATRLTLVASLEDQLVFQQALAYDKCNQTARCARRLRFEIPPVTLPAM